MITDQELKLFSEWNDTNSDETKVNHWLKCLPNKLHQTLKNRVIVSKRQSNLRELNRRANSVANYLLKSNLDKRQPIGY
jgi:hypothetical protein